MVSPRATRRLAIGALAIIWILVCGGLGWATRSAVQLDHLEDRAAAFRAYDELLAVAVARMEAVIDPVLGREQYRPYEHYRRYYKPAHVVAAVDEFSPPGAAVLVPSPLKDARPEPNWLLLYFQASEAPGVTDWSSPQLDAGFEFAVPYGNLPTADRSRIARPENWLAGLRDQYSPFQLLEMLTRTVSQAAHRAVTTRPSAGDDNHADDAARPDHRRTETEFARRVAKLREYYPPEVCVPETVALENLGAQVPDLADAAGGLDCVRVTRTPMTPIWLDLAKDGRQQLAMIRSVYVETSAFCALQGVLADWERLRADLLDEIRDLFPREEYPGVNLVPAAAASAPGAEPRSALMSSLPVRLVTGPPRHPVVGSISTSLMIGLVTAWVATILALSAISYGTAKYVSLAERRMRFVAAVTHELRTPLTTFQLYTDLLADGAANDPKRRMSFVETLRGESKRLSRLVENVLAYARMGNKRPRLSLAEVHPADVLDAVAEEAAAKCAAAGKQIVVNNRCQDGQAVRTDHEFVVQILSNLVDNACKYSAGAADNRIWLSAERAPGGEMVFQIEDGGGGVNPAERRGVFEPFRRGRKDEATAGMGLGLALSRYWAECLGGRLQLRRGTHQGDRWTCFVLTLPADRNGHAAH